MEGLLILLVLLILAGGGILFGLWLTGASLALLGAASTTCWTNTAAGKDDSG
jgi:hypothetical protein